MTKFIDSIVVTRESGIVTGIEAFDADSNYLCSFPCTEVHADWRARERGSVSFTFDGRRVEFTTP